MTNDQSLEPIERLSEPQKQCLRLVATLRTSKEIARIYDISPHTVDQRLKRAQSILGVSTRAEAARMLIDHENRQQIDPAEPCEELVYQSSDVPVYRYARDKGATFGEQNPPNVGGLDELHEQQAAFSHDVFAPHPKPSFLSVLFETKRENDLSIPARAGLIFAIMLAGLLGFSLLVNIAEGLSRIA